VLHVFIETNWVVDFAAPGHYRAPAAVRLLDRARSGELRLHLPIICLTEARRPILAKHQSRHADTIRQFLKWARTTDLVAAEDEAATRRVLNLLERQVRIDLNELDQTLTSLTQQPGLEVFPFDGAMLEKTAGFALEKLDLHPFDQAILAAVLLRAGTLRSEGETEFAFCELDSDLQPWDKHGKRKEPLTSLYDVAGIWVYSDFVLKSPPRPENWTGGHT
jgi:hypothetical protein